MRVGFGCLGDSRARGIYGEADFFCDFDLSVCGVGFIDFNFIGECIFLNVIFYGINKRENTSCKCVHKNAFCNIIHDSYTTEKA